MKYDYHNIKGVAAMVLILALLISSVYLWDQLYTPKSVTTPPNQFGAELTSSKLVKSGDLVSNKQGQSNKTSRFGETSVYTRVPQFDNITNIDAEYRENLLNHTGPISEVITDLQVLSDLGDVDAEFKLFASANTFCELKSENNKYCPDELKKFKIDQQSASLYLYVKKLASSGSIMAMTNLQFYVPNPFKNQLDLERNRMLRIQNPEVVTDYYQSVRKYLGIAANTGYPDAMLDFAGIYLSGNGFVDPDRKESAFWILAWSQVTNNTVPGLFKKNTLDTLLSNELNLIQARVERFEIQIKKVGVKRQ